MPHIPRHPVDEYAAWAMTLWFPSGRESLDKASSEMMDLAVMGLGLAGEALETLEATVAAGPLDRLHATKELGDSLYYWCVACSRAGVEPSSAWPSENLFHEAPEPLSREAIVLAAARLAIAAGQCSEAIKKMIRDGADGSRMSAFLPECAERWTQLCSALGLSPAEVVLANRAKLAGRVARGTLRGDGNDR